MDCADAKLRMEPCASGALVPEELALFEEHVAACEGCRLELELVRAMGTSKADAPKSDDWTLDRIFGADSSKDRGVPSSGSEPPPIDSSTAGAGAPTMPASSEAGAAEAAMLFESTPNPTPAESPSVDGLSPFGGPSTPPSTATSSTEAPSVAEGVATTDAPSASDASFSSLELEARGASSTAAPVGVAPEPAPSAKRTTPQSWDFEPADAKPEASLPEGSLFFAEETLARQGGTRKGRGSVKRLVLWGAGAIVGLGLLALSLWIGLYAREGNSDLKTPVTTTPGAEGVVPEPESPGDSTSQVAAADAPPAGASDVVTQPADEVVPNPPVTPATSSSVVPNTAKPGASPLMGARALTGTGVPALPSPTRTGAQPVAPRSTSGAPAATSGKGASKKSTSTAAPKQGATAPVAHSAPPEPTGRAMANPRTPPVTLPSPEQDIPFAGGADEDDVEDNALPSQQTPVPPTSTPSTVTVSKPPAPIPADSAPATPPTDAVQRPIDRLHVATVTAEESADLVALRKLRETWKGFVRTSVGPDRARAKRELGDCLWAIQALTGRKSDKKEALAAYREYLLNAPAGGADPRTVARMRQLEDALAESN